MGWWGDWVKWVNRNYMGLGIIAFIGGLSDVIGSIYLYDFHDQTLEFYLSELGTRQRDLDFRTQHCCLYCMMAIIIVPIVGQNFR